MNREEIRLSLRQRFSSSRLSAESTELFDEDSVFGDSFEMEDSLTLTVPSFRRNNKRREQMVENDNFDIEIDRNSALFINDERILSKGDVSPPPSIASRGSTSTIAGSRTGTPMMDQTLTTAFRDKIRNRLQTAKQKIRQSVKSDLRTQQISEFDEQIQLRLKQQSQWKQNLEKLLETEIQKEEPEVSREEAYEFFTRTDWDDVNTSIESKTSINIEKEIKGEAIQIEKEEEDSRLMIKDVFGTEDKWSLYERSKIIIKPLKERIADESKFIYFPSTAAPSYESRFDTKQSFNAQEDGLYTEQTSSSIEDKNFNKLKNRIIREGSAKKWFDDTGNFLVKSNTSIVAQKCMLLIRSDDNDNLCERHNTISLEETLASNSKAKYELIVKINSLKFTDHYLFSEEHVTARKLVEAYEVYREMIDENVISIICRKLNALQITISNLRETFSNDQLSDKDERIEMYKKLLLKTYNERNEKIGKFRNTLINMLKAWDEIQRIRGIQEFVCTNVRLICTEQININVNSEKRVWNELITEALELEKYLFKQNDERAHEEYRKELRNWKQWQRTKRRSSNKGESIEIDISTDEQNEHTKPEPPKQVFDESEAIERIQNSVFLSDGRLPGEPKYTEIVLEYSENVTIIKELSKDVQKKLNDLLKRKYNIQLFVNDKQFCQTMDRESDINFVVIWNQTFNVSVSHSRVKIKVNINERQNINNNKIGEINIPLPDGMTIHSNASPIKIKFTAIDSSSNAKHLNISGILELSLYWNIDNNGTIKCPSDLLLKNTNKDYQNLKTLDSNQLLQWMHQLSLQDPNDPNNVNMIQTIKNYKESLENGGSIKMIQNDNKDLEFATEEDIENNRRFRMLKLRWNGDPNFKGYRFVPLDEKEIPKDIIEKKIKPETSLKGKKGFEAKREEALKILSKVREQLMRQSQGSFDRPRTLEDMVIEDDIPSIGMLGFTLISGGQSKRPLNPYRRERKKIASNLISNSEIKIVITIMYALNVPVRCNDESIKRPSLSEFDNYESKVFPFVEAIFQRESSRTNTAEGSKPTWNETLTLKFTSPGNDFSPSSLTKISDCIYLNLFDEVTVDSREDITEEGEQIVYHKVERRWLGSLGIPFSTLYLNSKIEGTFSLSTPQVLLGYEYDSKGWLLGAHTAGHNTADVSKHTYLTLFVTIDPSLQLPEPLAIKVCLTIKKGEETNFNDKLCANALLQCDTIESESLMLYAKKWEDDLSRQYSGRNIKALAIDLNAKLVLVTRYLRPLKPPEDLLLNITQTEDAMQRLARFISLIPSIPDSIVLPGISDIWSNCDQFLEMLMGDEEEHAVLLCNYFLFLGKRAGVILGSGNPEGSTAYVIVWEYTGQEPHVWNATTGEQFSVRDSYVPLNVVGCIITPDNVYGNVGKDEHPNRLNYDITKTSQWKPLFNKSFPNQGLNSVQPETLDYGTIDHDYTLELQEKLEKHLRNSLMKWRKRSRTFFNRHCIQSIRKILPRLEKKVGKLENSDLIQELSDILVVHKMTGFPLNMPYTDMNSITEAVYATGVHLAEDKNVEFALAVYVHPYPCNILSVWVYIAALTRHN